MERRTAEDVREEDWRQEKIMCAAAAMGTKVYACYHEKKNSPKKHTKTLFKKLSLKNYTKAGYTGRCRETPVSGCVFTELVSSANNSFKSFCR